MIDPFEPSSVTAPSDPRRIAVVCPALQYVRAPDVFATAFFALLDPASGALTYCSAGHTTAMRLGSDGAVTELGSNGSIIGAFAGLTFSNVETRLGDGEVLFLYTDGLTEARSGGGLYGEARLAEVLSAQACHDPEAVV